MRLSSITIVKLGTAVAKAFGSRRIIAVDVSEPRLQFAKNLAATEIYRPPAIEKGEANTDYSRRVANDMATKLSIDLISGSESIDFVFECTGMEVCLCTGVMITRTSGTFVTIGLGNTFATMP